MQSFYTEEEKKEKEKGENENEQMEKAIEFINENFELLHSVRSRIAPFKAKKLDIKKNLEVIDQLIEITKNKTELKPKNISDSVKIINKLTLCIDEETDKLWRANIKQAKINSSNNIFKLFLVKDILEHLKAEQSEIEHQARINSIFKKLSENDLDCLLTILEEAVQPYKDIELNAQGCIPFDFMIAIIRKAPEVLESNKIKISEEIMEEVKKIELDDDRNLDFYALKNVKDKFSILSDTKITENKLKRIKDELICNQILKKIEINQEKLKNIEEKNSLTQGEIQSLLNLLKNENYSKTIHLICKFEARYILKFGIANNLKKLIERLPVDQQNIINSQLNSSFNTIESLKKSLDEKLENDLSDLYRKLTDNLGIDKSLVTFDYFIETILPKINLLRTAISELKVYKNLIEEELQPQLKRLKSLEGDLELLNSVQENEIKKIEDKIKDVEEEIDETQKAIGSSRKKIESHYDKKINPELKKYNLKNITIEDYDLIINAFDSIDIKQEFYPFLDTFIESQKVIVFVNENEEEDYPIKIFKESVDDNIITFKLTELRNSLEKDKRNIKKMIKFIEDVFSPVFTLTRKDLDNIKSKGQKKLITAINAGRMYGDEGIVLESQHLESKMGQVNYLLNICDAFCSHILERTNVNLRIAKKVKPISKVSKEERPKGEKRTKTSSQPKRKITKKREKLSREKNTNQGRKPTKSRKYLEEESYPILSPIFKKEPHDELISYEDKTIITISKREKSDANVPIIINLDLPKKSININKPDTPREIKKKEEPRTIKIRRSQREKMTLFAKADNTSEKNLHLKELERKGRANSVRIINKPLKSTIVEMGLFSEDKQTMSNESKIEIKNENKIEIKNEPKIEIKNENKIEIKIGENTNEKAALADSTVESPPTRLTKLDNN